MENQTNKYSFTASIPTAITFDIPDSEGKPLNYLFRLPSANDLAPLREGEKERAKYQAQLQNPNATEEQKEAAQKGIDELNAKAEQIFNGLVGPVGHSVKFEDALNAAPVSVAKAVNEMMLKEMGVEGE